MFFKCNLENIWHVNFIPYTDAKTNLRRNLAKKQKRKKKKKFVPYGLFSLKDINLKDLVLCLDGLSKVGELIKKETYKNSLFHTKLRKNPRFKRGNGLCWEKD